MIQTKVGDSFAVGLCEGVMTILSGPASKTSLEVIAAQNTDILAAKFGEESKIQLLRATVTRVTFASVVDNMLKYAEDLYRGKGLLYITGFSMTFLSDAHKAYRLSNAEVISMCADILGPLGYKVDQHTRAHVEAEATMWEDRCIIRDVTPDTWKDRK